MISTFSKKFTKIIFSIIFFLDFQKNSNLINKNFSNAMTPIQEYSFSEPPEKAVCHKSAALIQFPTHYKLLDLNSKTLTPLLDVSEKEAPIGTELKTKWQARKLALLKISHPPLEFKGLVKNLRYPLKIMNQPVNSPGTPQEKSPPFQKLKPLVKFMIPIIKDPSENFYDSDKISRRPLKI